MSVLPITNPASKRDTDTFLRGVAIICVVLIHFLSSYKESPFVTESDFQVLAITLDQLARVAVPLFVALSGYGLMLKYQRQSPRWKEYFQKRILKLVPLYVLWSCVYWFVFLYIPQWRPTAEVKPFFGQLLFGNADYHLYFVPMIFQLYLLFPLLLTAVKRYPKVMVLATAAFQLFFFWLVEHKVTGQPGITFFQSDQQQYIWFFSWIYYFVLGMCLPKIVRWVRAIKWGELAVYLLTVVTGAWLAYSAVAAINSGIDPLVALRFTRLEVLLYAGFCIVTLYMLTTRIQNFPKLLLLVGEHSYLLYLSHTLLLRVAFLFIN